MEASNHQLWLANCVHIYKDARGVRRPKPDSARNHQWYLALVTVLFTTSGIGFKLPPSGFLPTRSGSHGRMVGHGSR